jgi:catechol 2,3-dioxygenase-like lactoylglutathione lyase family enzyme
MLHCASRNALIGSAASELKALGGQSAFNRDSNPEPSVFQQTHPILGTRDVRRAIEFYTHQLGFELAFKDNADAPNYVGFRRDAVELHMQFQFEHEMGTTRLRLLVSDPDALFSEYREHGVECTPNAVRDTPWGTREFALYDLDRNALTFYRQLTRAEAQR